MPLFHKERAGLEFERMLLTVKEHMILFSKPEKKGHYKLLKKGYIQYLTVLFMLFKNDTKRLIKSISQVLT